MNNDRIIEGDIGYWTLDNNNALVIYIPNSLGAIEARSFRKAFEHICKNTISPSKIILNFSRTSFLDSSGIGALANIITMSKMRGIDLTVCGITIQVHSILKMTRLDRLLSMKQNEAIRPEAAIKEQREFGQNTVLVH